MNNIYFQMMSFECVQKSNVRTREMAGTQALCSRTPCFKPWFENQHDIIYHHHFTNQHCQDCPLSTEPGAMHIYKHYVWNVAQKQKIRCEVKRLYSIKNINLIFHILFYALKIIIFGAMPTVLKNYYQLNGWGYSKWWSMLWSVPSPGGTKD